MRIGPVSVALRPIFRRRFGNLLSITRASVPYQWPCGQFFAGGLENLLSITRASVRYQWPCGLFFAGGLENLLSITRASVQYQWPCGLFFAGGLENLLSITRASVRYQWPCGLLFIPKGLGLSDCRNVRLPDRRTDLWRGGSPNLRLCRADRPLTMKKVQTGDLEISSPSNCVVLKSKF